MSAPLAPHYYDVYSQLLNYILCDFRLFKRMYSLYMYCCHHLVCNGSVSSETLPGSDHTGLHTNSGQTGNHEKSIIGKHIGLEIKNQRLKTVEDWALQIEFIHLHHTWIPYLIFSSPVHSRMATWESDPNPLTRSHFMIAKNPAWPPRYCKSMDLGYCIPPGKNDRMFSKGIFTLRVKTL